MNKKLIKRKAKQVISLVDYNASQLEAKDIPEFISFEVIDLVEIMVDLPLQRYVAKNIIESDYLDVESKGIVRKYFDIWR